MNAKVEQTVYMTKELKKRLEGLAEAKEAIKKWTEYQANLEGAILEDLKSQGIVFPESGSIEVGADWLLLFVKAREFDQGCAATFCEKYPGLQGVLFHHQWKPADKAVIDSFLGSPHAGVEDLKGCFKERSNKPSFRARAKA